MESILLTPSTGERRSVNARKPTIAAAVVGAMLALAACTGGRSAATTEPGFDAAAAHVVNPSDRTGGTVRLVAGGDCDSWDPARTYYAYCWDLQRLFTRTLMGYRPAPGLAGATLVPDLATGPGKVSADGLTWTYYLKHGLRFQNGQAITSADIKYGIERLYASGVINGGPNAYFSCLLDTCDAAGNPTYRGPYAQPSATLDQIDASDPYRIVFHLSHRYGDFDYLMALPASAPIPKASDTGATYTQHVVSSGPYEFSSYQPGRSVVWVRNPEWSQSTDSIRRPRAARITMTVVPDPAAAGQAIATGAFDAQADGSVPAWFESRVLSNPKLRKYADDPYTMSVDYLALSATVPPLNDIHCRLAVFYAIDKAALQDALGGPTEGTIANSLTPPTLPGYDPESNVYPDGPADTGDLGTARRELALCGHPDGFRTTMTAFPATVFNAVEDALARVGIEVTPQPTSPEYFNTYLPAPGSLRQTVGIATPDWGPDFPTGSNFWNFIDNGENLAPILGYPSVEDPAVSALLTSDLATQAPRSTAALRLDAQLNSQITKDAVFVPYLYPRNLDFHSSRLTNVYVLGTFGLYDYVNLGVH
jgi:peptide/nickel transport system substrate-binding protein